MPEREEVLRATRIIHTAILLGPALFLAVVIYLVRSGDGELGSNETGSLISYVSLAAALGALMVAPMLPRILHARPGDRLASFRALVVVRAAILEGPALFGCVAYMLEGNRTPIGAAVAVFMILCLAATAPTEAKLDAWLTSPDAPPSEK